MPEGLLMLTPFPSIPSNFSPDVPAGVGPGDFPPWIYLTLQDAADVSSWLVGATSLLMI